MRVCWSEPSPARPTVQELLHYLQGAPRARVLPISLKHPVPDDRDGRTEPELAPDDEWSRMAGAPACLGWNPASIQRRGGRLEGVVSRGGEVTSPHLCHGQASDTLYWLSGAHGPCELHMRQRAVLFRRQYLTPARPLCSVGRGSGQAP